MSIGRWIIIEEDIMGNNNAKITFPIDNNKHLKNVEFNNLKVKSKQTGKNNQNNNSKTKEPTNHKLSSTPDRNVNIVGIKTDKNCSLKM